MSKSVSAVQAEQAAARRKRNITIASIVLGVLVVAGIAIALAGGGEEKSGSTASNLNNVAQTKKLLAGIPQHGKILGDPNAKVTMIEFADLQCPFCKQFAVAAFPHLVRDYVRTGKVKLELRTLAFVGADSQKAARAAAAAERQNRLWTFTDLFYNNQGGENSGFVTPKFLDLLFDASGMDKDRADAFIKTAESKVPLKDATDLAEQYGVIQTPTFVAGPTNGTKDIIEVSNTDPRSLAVLDKLAE